MNYIKGLYSAGTPNCGDCAQDDPCANPCNDCTPPLLAQYNVTIAGGGAIDGDYVIGYAPKPANECFWSKASGTGTADPYLSWTLGQWFFSIKVPGYFPFGISSDGCVFEGTYAYPSNPSITVTISAPP